MKRVGTNQKNDFRLGDLSFKVIDACYEVHNQMGPGLLEKVYHQGLLMALKKRISRKGAKT